MITTFEVLTTVYTLNATEQNTTHYGAKKEAKSGTWQLRYSIK